MPNLPISQLPEVSAPAAADYFPLVQSSPSLASKKITAQHVLANAKSTVTHVVAPSSSGVFADFYTTGTADNTTIQSVIDPFYAATLTFTGLPTASQTIVVGSDTYTFVALRSASFQVTIGGTAAATAANFLAAFTSDNTNTGLTASVNSAVVSLASKAVTVTNNATNVTYACGGTGLSLLLRAGTYTMSGGVTLIPDLTILGEGIGKTIIQPAAGWASGDMFTIGSGYGTSSGSDPAGTFSNLCFRDLEIACSNGVQGGHTAFVLHGASNVRVERNYIHDSYGYGMYFANPTNIWVSRNIVSNLLAAGTQACIQFKGAVNGWIVDNYCYNAHAGGGNQGIDSHATDGVNGRDDSYNHILGNYVDLCSQGINCEDSDSVIEGNVVTNTQAAYGIGVTNSLANNVVVSGNVVDGGANANVIGIWASSGNDVLIAGNTVANINGNATGSDGITVSSGCTNVTVTGNTVRNSGRYGIFARQSGTKISDNNIYDDQGTPTQQYGVFVDTSVTDLQITGNIFKNNTSVQVRFAGANSNNLITHNVFNGGARGILYSGNNNNANNIVLDNQFENNSTAALTFTGAGIGSGSIVRNNFGYVTENSGTATVASGSTSIAVSHGLSVTPATKDIILTPTNNLGSATKFWVSSPTSSQFTVNTDVDPGATTATFGWKAVVL